MSRMPKRSRSFTCQEVPRAKKFKEFHVPAANEEPKAPQSLTSAIMYHVDALDALDTPLRDKHWHSLGWTPIPEPASWHPDPHIRYQAMAAAYKAGSDFMKQENLSQWTAEAVDVAKQAAYMFKGECEFASLGCGMCGSMVWCFKRCHLNPNWFCGNVY